MNQEKKCEHNLSIAGNYVGCVKCGTNSLIPESPTHHATDWEKELEEKFAFVGIVIKDVSGNTLGETKDGMVGNKMTLKSFIRTTVDEAVRAERERILEAIDKHECPYGDCPRVRYHECLVHSIAGAAVRKIITGNI